MTALLAAIRTRAAPVSLASVLCALLLVTSAPADAKKAFAKRENKPCAHCHLNPNGGGPRNTTGLYYQAKQSLPTGLPDVEVQATVDEWLQHVMATPPNVVWRRRPLAQRDDVDPRPLTPATDAAVLRRMAFDLAGRPPFEAELESLQTGARTLEQLRDAYLASDDFSATFHLYHADLVRPRTGIFNQSASLTALVDDSGALRSTAIVDDDCSPLARVPVSPYWRRSRSVDVCRRTAAEQLTVEVDGKRLRCDTDAGQASGLCGCGPNLTFCYTNGDWNRYVKPKIVDETTELAMAVVENDLPYGQILTADWTMRNGRLDHFYARLDGNLGELDADTSQPFRRVERGAEHSGILTTHAYLNLFYNGRRWAQRTFEAFMCHQTYPDFDLLDEHDDAPPVSYRRHPLADGDINVNSGRGCEACHLQLDGLSRLKDRWDNQGQYYPVGTDDHPIPQSAWFQGELVDGLDEFGRALAGSEVFADCAVQQVWQHLTGRGFREDEIRTRRDLVARFTASNQNFRQLLRDATDTAEYRARDNIKLMERELYWRAMEQITRVRWTVDDRTRRGFDVFYDKVAGMDYRKIEARDRSVSQGTAMVLFKAANETCDAAVDRDVARKANARLLLPGVAAVDFTKPTVVDDTFERWYELIYARPAAEVDPDDLRIVRETFDTIAAAHSPADGYKAACAVMFAAADFALY